MLSNTNMVLSDVMITSIMKRDTHLNKYVINTKYSELHPIQ